MDRLRSRPGQRWTRLGRTARVLAVLDGYVIFRFPRAPVAAMRRRDFEQQFSLDRKDTTA